MNHSVDPEKIKAIIRDVAAEHIMPRFRRLEDKQIRTKTSVSDLVTDADIDTEVALTAILQDIVPGSKVIGEEAVSDGSVNMRHLLTHEPDHLWVIDPVDGTWNFAHSSPVFACMVAYRYKGETVMSWIYDPVRDVFAIAEKGQGAVYDNNPLKLQPAKQLENLVGYMGRFFAPKNIRKKWEEKEQEVAAVGAIRCSAHSYLRLARGMIDFHAYVRMKPWDHLSGELIYQEAGGLVKTWDGDAYNPLKEHSGLLIAPDEETWQALHKLFIRDVMDLRKHETE